MEKRPFGNSGFDVSLLGFGAGHIGSPDQSDADVERLLNGVLDAGCALIDTAVSYGSSEERIGKFIGHRRDEYVLSTKGGYSVEGHADWSVEAIGAGIDQALRRLKTDHLEIFHFHSCCMDYLRRDELLEALGRARDAGKITCAAYSGENDELNYAIDSDAFNSIQTSVNLSDQRGIDQYLPKAAEKKMGVIAKRPLANAFWRHDIRPRGQYCEEYWVRSRKMKLAPGELDWTSYALAFVASVPTVSSMIVGTSKLEHFLDNVKKLDETKLPPSLLAETRDKFRDHGENWIGQI